MDVGNLIAAHNETPHLSHFADRKTIILRPTITLYNWTRKQRHYFEFKNIINSIEKEIKEAHTGIPG